MCGVLCEVCVFVGFVCVREVYVCVLCECVVVCLILWCVSVCVVSV